MTAWGAVLLGLVQGLGEFFPVSSSAHLSILQNFLRIGTQDHLFFDVLLGTLAAVITAFFPDVRALVSVAAVMVHFKAPPKGKGSDPQLRRMISFLIIGSLPLVLVLFVKDAVESLYSNTFFIGFALLVTGGLLFWAARNCRGSKNVKNT
ncbi:MAG: undecaprenyl-diphosphate phosphatase, partial [Clostridia bacterium]|nr:undecaprenyl-diphosphate phosphatase [Clostridia bacterium]